MSQTLNDLFGAGSTLVEGVLTIDFSTVGRNDGIDSPATITPSKAASAILKRFATLTAANDVPTAAIAAANTPSTPQYFTTRGGTAVTQLRKATTIYEFYSATNPTDDPDNLI